MSYPFMDVVETPIEGTVESTKALPLFKEYDWDFAKNDFKLKDGNLHILEGDAALKIWIEKTLRTERFTHLAYSDDYGTEVQTLLGRVLLPKEENSLCQMIADALLVNPYITDVNRFIVTREGLKVNVQFNVVTLYGEMEVYKGGSL